MDWKLLGALYDYDTTISFPAGLKEIQVVIGVGKYRMIFNVSENALSAAIGSQVITCSAKVFMDENWHEVSAVIKFIIGQNAYVGIITLDEAVIYDFIVWFYYR